MTTEDRADLALANLLKAEGADAMKKILVSAFLEVERDAVGDILGASESTRTKKLLDNVESAYAISHWLLRCSKSFSRDSLREYCEVFASKAAEFEKVLRDFAPDRLESYDKEFGLDFIRRSRS